MDIMEDQNPQASQSQQFQDQPQAYSFPSQGSSDSPKGLGPVSKIFSTMVWVVLFFLAPPTVLVLLSQNSLPGDLFYPLKRGMENAILAAASVNPSTRASFRTDLTTTRFREAERLLLGRSDTAGLSNFLTEIQTTQQELSALSNETKKKELTEKLLVKIDEYQTKLSQVEVQVQSTASIVRIVPSEQKQQSSTSSITPASTPAALSPAPTQTAVPSLTKTMVTPSVQILTAKTTPTPTINQSKQIFEPTSAPLVTQPEITLLAATPTPAPSVSVPTLTPAIEQPFLPVEPIHTPEENVVAAIDQTQKRLDEIKNKLAEMHSEVKQKEKAPGLQLKDKRDKEEKDKKDR